MKIVESSVNFIVDYCQRHANPTNAILHLIGIPMVVVGVYWWFKGEFLHGLGLFLSGYFLQYLGHRTQGNEVGEVVLIKNLVAKVRRGN